MMAKTSDIDEKKQDSLKVSGKRPEFQEKNVKKPVKPEKKSQYTKSTNSLFMIWDALRQHASRSEPLQGSEVHAAVVKLYGEEDAPNIDTVRNNLRDLSENPEAFNSPIKVKCLAKKQFKNMPSKFISYNDCCEQLEKEKGRELTPKEKPNRYYYLENPLSEGQWRALMDMIRFTPLISQKDTQDMLSNFRQLGGLPYGNDHAIHQFKRENRSYFDVISNLERRIRLKEQVEITYGTHMLQNNQNGRLVPHLVEKKGRVQYLVSPLSLLWSSGSYYLVALYKSRHIHFRVDRIISVSKGKEKFDYPADFFITKHRESCPFMYGGDKSFITFICEEELLNQVMDHFGTSPRYSLKNGKIEVTVEATENGMKLFALLNQKMMEVKEPIHLREEIRAILEESIEKYKKTP